MTRDLSELLFNSLNEQGYLFQEACFNALKTKERGMGWEVKAYDYPVSLEGQDTKTDMVLQSTTSPGPELYALVECKRADPSYVYWLFGAGQELFGDAYCLTLGLECLRYDSTAGPYQPVRHVERLPFRLKTYKPISWLEAKMDTSKRSSTPQNLENAFGQVLRGVAGFAEEHRRQRGKTCATFSAFFIPVVVTTAQLYVATYEPHDIDLSTGRVNKDQVNFGPPDQLPQEEFWVLVDYSVGENLAPESIPEEYYGVDPNELVKYKTRSIFVVNSKFLVKFFSFLRLKKDS